MAKQKIDNFDRGLFGTLTGIIYCPQSNHYVYMINGDAVSIYDDKLLVNTSKCSIESITDEIRMQVLKELTNIVLDMGITVNEELTNKK